jgi:hypothetical protein
MSNTVEVQSTGQVLVSETSEHAIEVQVPAQPALVEVATAGPQGPTATVAGLNDLSDVNTTAKVAKSILYYDAESGEWKGDSAQTILTVTDYGNF